MQAASNVILKITNRFFRGLCALLLYRIIQLVLLPIIGLYFLLRLISSRSYWAHFGERFGFLPPSLSPTKPGAIWLHAVSVGEIVSAVPLIRILKRDQPGIPVYLSTSTVAGRNAALRQATDLVDGVFYSPFDYPSCVRRVLRRLKPALLIVFETEIWPNLYAETKGSGAQLAIVNGRISNRTWPRYRAWKRWFCPILQFPDLILVQSSVDYARYIELGAPPAKLALAANLKYDAPQPAAEIKIDIFAAEQVWIAASTVGPNERGSFRRHSVDEDDTVLDSFETLAREFPKLLLILVPRQPERFELVARKLAARNIRFLRRTVAKTDPALSLDLPGVLLLDTVGELSGTYKLANVAFVGGSLAPRGGHNILEPAAAAVPVIVGPHMENFEAIAQDFLEAGAILQIRTGADLTTTVRDLLKDSDRARQIGSRALRRVEARRGASAQVAARLWPIYHCCTLRNIRHPVARLLLAPLAGLWKEGGALKRYRSEHFTLIAPPLSALVISVGGITAGGSGKTPFAVYLVSRLKARGYSPAILTRGYGRRSPAETLVFAPRAKVPSAATGDEAQIFLRSTDAPIGIGTKRYETAQVLLRQFPSTDILVLDDGFQHARLQRDVDVVLIDGLDPFGGEDVMPLGRLREPLNALCRAHAFVVTRAEEALRFQAIARRLGELNPKAPAFRTRLIARSWHDYRNGQVLPSLAGRRVGAFCALGNPENFWQTLAALGLAVVFRWQFPDHHSYNPTELQRVAHQARIHGADILVTTEKDLINCPSHLERVIAPLDLAWLKIELELEDESRFFNVVEKLLVRSRPRHFAS
ncbi:MAG: tetraacyldisaccharide 4'-kinase [Acidobacteriaceae bacterium]|nr:tetraacyldisaccharide 4'-kinase [Acidobacteriaceae bacterium]